MSMKPEQHATTLVRYFERCAAETPSDERWQLGTEMSKEWLRLINAERATPEEVEALSRVVDVYKNSGSGWFDLACGISHWAISNGFTIPYPHWPHKVSKNSESAE
jgi:hypothetical protein